MLEVKGTNKELVNVIEIFNKSGYEFCHMVNNTCKSTCISCRECLEKNIKFICIEEED